MLFAEERVALRTATRKYVRWANGKEEAYDLVDDPGERRDLAGSDAVVTPLRAELDRLERDMPPAAVVERPDVAAATASLRALGYVQ